MTVEALRKKKKEEAEKRVKLVLLFRFSQIVATALLVIGMLYFLFILYLRYYS